MTDITLIETSSVQKQMLWEKLNVIYKRDLEDMYAYLDAGNVHHLGLIKLTNSQDLHEYVADFIRKFNNTKYLNKREFDGFHEALKQIRRTCVLLREAKEIRIKRLEERIAALTKTVEGLSAVLAGN